MSMRERWLVGLMIGALVYGGYTLVTRAVRKDDSFATADAALVGVRAFAEATRKSMEALHLTPDEEFVLDAAVGIWPASPFYERPDKLAAVTDQPKEVRYTGYFHVGVVKLAILNGREYRIREPVESTDFVVESIEADRVVLASKGGGRRVSIALNESAKNED